MKQTFKSYSILFCTCLLLLAGCKDGKEEQLKNMLGEWGSKSGNTAFVLTEENGRYEVTRTIMLRGRKKTETFILRQTTDGNIYIDTGFTVMLSYDRENDRIILSPGGEYKRVTNPKNKTR